MIEPRVTATTGGRTIRVQWQNNRLQLVSHRAHIKAHRSGEEAYYGKKQGKHRRTECHLQVDKRQLQCPPDAEVKVPGYFGAWAKRFRWKE